MNKKIPIALGVFLLAGALFGSFNSLKNVVNYISDGNWSFVGPQLLFLLAFVYIATVGFKLIKNNTHVAKQAKWIFLLQALIISIQGIFHWSWSTGLQGLIGYSSKYGVLTHFPIPFYQAGANFYFQPADTMVGINFVALGLAWVAHKITKQTIQSPTDILTSNIQAQVESTALIAQISEMFNHHSFGALLQKWTIASSLIKLVLGALLIYGAIVGAVGTLEYIDGYLSDNDYLRGGLNVLYLLTFIYIGVIGFKLSGHFGNVITKAKWIFALQVPILNIPHMINWSWSTGVGANIGFEGSEFLIEMVQLQSVDINFLYPDDEFGIGFNLAALFFTYLLHLLGKQKLNGQNSAMQVAQALAANTPASEDHYVQAYQELQTKTQNIATWAKALASSHGDNDIAEATYLRTRVQALQQTNISNQTSLTHKTSMSFQVQLERDWSFKKKLIAGLIAIVLAVLVILFASGSPGLNFSDESTAQIVETSKDSKYETNKSLIKALSKNACNQTEKLSEAFKNNDRVLLESLVTDYNCMMEGYVDLLGAAILLDKEEFVRFLSNKVDREKVYAPGIVWAGIARNQNYLELFLSQGQDINATSLSGQNVVNSIVCSDLQISKDKEYLSLLRLALGKGGNPSHADDLGKTALHCTNSPEYVELLVSNGANVNAADHQDVTPLASLASGLETHHLESAKILIKHGANLNTQDTSHGWSALHWAVDFSAVNMVKLLLDSGIDAELIDNDGKTALMLANAKSSPNAEIIRLLSDNRRN